MSIVKVSKKAQQTEQILDHGRKLIILFNLPSETDALDLCKRLRRLEGKAHRLAEDYCNGLRGMDEADQEQLDHDFEKILNKVDELLGFSKLNIPVFINRDPRGYALKINDEWLRAHTMNQSPIYTDWGGYGLIAPEFTGE